MTEFVLERSDPKVALYHLALYGLAAIIEATGATVRLHWTRGQPARACLHMPDLDDGAVGRAVQEHAARLTDPDAWMSQDVTLGGTARGLMSPRLSIFPDQQTWQEVQRARHRVLDELTAHRAFLDLRMVASLGEPAYWVRNNKGEIQQDSGASRWEMQARNQGSEIVGTRLRKLADAVAARSADAVVAGLRGLTPVDEIGKGKDDSRTATGLTVPGPTDNALAWCALWGISQLPVAMRVSSGRRQGMAVTTGHIGRTRAEWFYLPIWHEPWRPARLRTIVASVHLQTVARDGVDWGREPPTVPALAAAHAWLASRSVAGFVRFPIVRFGSDNAPERRAMGGELVAVGA